MSFAKLKVKMSGNCVQDNKIAEDVYFIFILLTLT